MAMVSSKNSIIEAMRHHSKGREVSVEILDYGYAIAIAVGNRSGTVSHTTRLPAKTPCAYNDPEKQMLCLMGFIPPNYRMSTEEDNIKYAVDFVKRTVSK
jgi:hypothetical protein